MPTIHRHLRASMVLWMVGEELWSRAQKFSVIRNPWDIVASDYRLTLYHARHDFDLNAEGGAWNQRVERMRVDARFERFVTEEYLSPECGILSGGFWRTWCCDEDGREMGVEAVRYECLAEPAIWTALLNKLGVPSQTVRLRLNGAPTQPVGWTPQLIRKIGELCHYDVNVFGYEPPLQT